jgi:hypothetical protein
MSIQDVLHFGSGRNSKEVQPQGWQSRIALELLSDLGCNLLEQTRLALFEDGHQKNRLAVALFFPQLTDIAFLFAVVVGRIDC